MSPPLPVAACGRPAPRRHDDASHPAPRTRLPLQLAALIVVVRAGERAVLLSHRVFTSTADFSAEVPVKCAIELSCCGHLSQGV